MVFHSSSPLLKAKAQSPFEMSPLSLASSAGRGKRVFSLGPQLPRDAAQLASTTKRAELRMCSQAQGGPAPTRT